jgi:NAD+ diphosphatase
MLMPEKSLPETPWPEISANLAFSGSRLTRDAEKRSDTIVAEALNDPATWVLRFVESRLIIDVVEDVARAFVRRNAPEIDAEKAVFLGRDAAGAAVLAAPVTGNADALDPGLKAIDLRSLVAQSLFEGPLLGDIAYGASLLAWHRNAGFCTRCGQQTAMKSGGAKRVCPHCTAEHFPRVDPVAIMLIVRDGHCLLGRSRHFPAGMLSCLAGFIEQGETIEDAVRREGFEESGISIGAVRYVASQPWPMPHSLMIGCIGEATSETINHDAEELELCQWFSRDDLQAMLAGTHPQNFTAPLKGAIARTLMQLWADGAV